MDPLCVEHRDALAEAVAAFAASEVAAAERDRDAARREAATWKMHAYDHGYQP